MIQGDKVVSFYCFAVSELLFLTSSLSLLLPSALTIFPSCFPSRANYGYPGLFSAADRLVPPPHPSATKKALDYDNGVREARRQLAPVGHNVLGLRTKGR